MWYKTLCNSIITLRKSKRRQSSLMHCFRSKFFILIKNYFNNVIRQNKRKIDFFKENVGIVQEKDLEKLMKNKEKKVILRFLLNPH